MKDSSIIFGIDPSFSGFGYAIIDKQCHTIRTYRMGSSLGKRSFINIALKSMEVVNNFIEQNAENLGTNTVVGMENALPQGFMASGLMALDTLLYRTLGTERTATFNPTYLSFIMGKHSKADSINLANGLIKIFCENGYTLERIEGKKLSSDEAEAMIYATRMFVRNNNEHLSRILTQVFPSLSEARESVNSDFIF